MDHAISLVIFALLFLAGLIMEAIGFIDNLLAHVMTALHVPPNAQIILLVVAALYLAVMAIRALGGVFAALIIALLVLLLLHQSFPGMQVPPAQLPATSSSPQTPI